jgi:hypothetical protein
MFTKGKINYAIYRIDENLMRLAVGVDLVAFFRWLSR